VSYNFDQLVYRQISWAHTYNAGSRLSTSVYFRRFAGPINGIRSRHGGSGAWLNRHGVSLLARRRGVSQAPNSVTKRG